MPELTPDDVEQYTNGRLKADNPETQRMLDAALVVARREAGWHVSPVELADVVVLDGPRSRVLELPTLRLLVLTEIVEDGEILDLTKLNWSVGCPTPTSWGGPAAVRKKSCQSWSCDYQSIQVTMDHGYTEAEAADWRQAVLSMVDQMSLLPASVASGRSDADLTRKRVDDVEYQWGDGTFLSMAEQVLFSVNHIIANYRLTPVYFA